LSIVRYSKKLENTRFRILDLFPSSGEVGGDTYFVGSQSLDSLSQYNSSSSIILSRDRSIASSKLSFSVFGERLSRKSCNVVVFPFDFHIAVQQPLKPLWSRLLLCDHEPSQPCTVLCFMSLLMSLLPASGEFLSEFSSFLILDLTGLGDPARSLSSRRHRSRDHGEY
jgi:hypothetical protein